MQRLVGVALSCALVMACGSKKRDEPAGGEPGTAGDTPPGATEAPPRKQVELVPEQDAKQLVATWLAAQNNGDFDAYQRLYAERFTGVKRIGPRAFTYDRAGWLKDRGRMFKKKMSVTVDEVSVSAGGKSAVVRFTQTWASGKFKDVGPKQLVVVREGDGLRIAREEMLESNVVGAEDDAGALAAETFSFAFTEGDTYVILAREADVTWATQDAELVARGSPAIARSPVVADELPEALRGWKGRAVALFPAQGAPCERTIDELYLLTGFEPHFGTLADWGGDPDMGDGVPAGDQDVADEAWGMGSDSAMLVGRVNEPCKGALWGRADDKNLVPRLVEQGRDVAALKAAAADRFRSLKGYRTIQREFEVEEPDAKGAWDEFEGSKPEVKVFYDPKVQRQFVAVGAMAGPGCGSFYGELWALFQVVPRGGKQELVLLTDDEAPGEYFFPDAVVDADADGDVEFVSANQLVRLVDGTYRIVASWQFPDYDCPC